MNMLQKSSDVNISSRSKLPTPDEIHSELPLSLDCVAQVIRHRQVRKAAPTVLSCCVTANFAHKLVLNAWLNCYIIFKSHYS